MNEIEAYARAVEASIDNLTCAMEVQGFTALSHCEYALLYSAIAEAVHIGWDAAQKHAARAALDAAASNPENSLPF